MNEIWFAIPGDPATLTGGYIYARRLTAALTGLGWRVNPLRLPDSYPNPTPADVGETRRILAGLPAGAVALADGLAFGAFPVDLFQGLNLRWVALVHHPLALETGVPESRAKALRESERAALAHARAVIATSPSTAGTLARDYGVPNSKLSVALPGTDPARRARGTGTPPILLTVGTLTPRKGHDTLIKALTEIADLDWSCALVGSTVRDPGTAARITGMIAAAGLNTRVAIMGELEADALLAVYDSADIFVLPSRHEGYGMVFAEALAHGLPILACAAGAVPDTVPSDARLLVPVDNPVALAGALRRLITNREDRQARADAAWRHGQALPRWNDTAAQVAAALQKAAV